MNSFDILHDIVQLFSASATLTTCPSCDHHGVPHLEIFLALVLLFDVEPFSPGFASSFVQLVVIC